KLHHATLDRDHALVPVLGPSKGSDDLARKSHLSRGWREHLVGDGHLVWMDQRLAVKAKSTAINALAPEALRIPDVIVDAVKHVEAIGARRRDCGREPVEGGAPVERQVGTGLLHEVVGAKHKAREPRSGPPRSRSDVCQVENRKGC